MSVAKTRYGQNVLQPVSQSVGRGDREEWRGGEIERSGGEIERSGGEEGGACYVLYNIDTPITESHASYTHSLLHVSFLT